MAVGELPTIPWKDFGEFRQDLDDVTEPKKLRVRFVNNVTGDAVTVGGIWDPVAKRYLDEYEIPHLPKADLKRLQKQKTPIVKLGDTQFRFVLYCLAALLNYERMAAEEPPEQLVMMHGARRSGKSVALRNGILAVAIARPAAHIWVVGLRKRHGQRIISGIRRTLADDLHDYQKRDQLLTLANHSSIHSKAAVNYDADRGDELDMLAIDEAAFMKEDVYHTLMPSVTSVNGFTAMATSPNKMNWVHELKELPRFSEDSAAAIKTVHLTPQENTFAPVVAKRAELARYVMSEERWRQEMMGEFSETSGLALPKFNRRVHIRDWSQINDYTTEVTSKFFRMRGSFEWIVGVDYNINPTCGVIIKVDTMGQIWACAEVWDAEGTDQFGRRLYRALQKMGVEDPYREALIVGDSSQESQDPRDKKHGASARILRAQGWKKVITPQSSRKVNPGRVNKLEMMRALHFNAAGEAHMFADPSCEYTLKMMQYLDLNDRGLPNRSNKYNHWFDALAYAVWRVWGDEYAGKTVGQRVFKRALVEAFTDDPLM